MSGDLPAALARISFVHLLMIDRSTAIPVLGEIVVHELLDYVRVLFKFCLSKLPKPPTLHSPRLCTDRFEGIDELLILPKRGEYGGLFFF